METIKQEAIEYAQKISDAGNAPYVMLENITQYYDYSTRCTIEHLKKSYYYISFANLDASLQIAVNKYYDENIHGNKKIFVKY